MICVCPGTAGAAVAWLVGTSYEVEMMGVIVTAEGFTSLQVKGPTAPVISLPSVLYARACKVSIWFVDRHEFEALELNGKLQAAGNGPWLGHAGGGEFTLGKTLTSILLIGGCTKMMVGELVAPRAVAVMDAVPVAAGVQVEYTGAFQVPAQATPAGVMSTIPGLLE